MNLIEELSHEKCDIDDYVCKCNQYSQESNCTWEGHAYWDQMGIKRPNGNWIIRKHELSWCVGISMCTITNYANMLKIELVES